MAKSPDTVILGRVMPDGPADDAAAALDPATYLFSEAPDSGLPCRDVSDRRSQRELQRELALRALI